MAKDRIKGITIEIDGSTVGLQKSLKTVNSTISKTQTALKDVNNRLKFKPTSTEMLRQKQQYLNTAVEETKKKLDQEKDALKQLQEAGKTVDNQEQQNALQREIEETTSRLKDLEKQARQASSVFGSQMQAVGDKIKTTGEKVTELGKKMKILSGASAGVLVGVTKSAIDFESAWTGVTKTVDGTDEQMAEIKQGILDLAKVTASSSSDIAAVAETAGQLGIETNHIIDFSEAMVRMGDSTNLSAENAASQLAKFANITQMSQKNFSNLGSAIVELGNNYETTENDIVEMAMRLAGAGKQIEMSEGQILGLATAMSSVGVEAEMGGSAMSKVMVKMQNAIELSINKLPGILNKTGMSLRELQLLSANNSKDFKELAGSLGMTNTELNNIVKAGVDLENFSSVAGMSAEQFKKAWQEDASGALTSFIQGLGNTKDKGESAITVLTEMGITEVRMRDALLRTSQASDLMSNAIKQGSEAFKENTALLDESNKRYETTESKLSQAKESVKDAAISLGETLLPTVNKVADSIKSLSEKFTELSPATQKTIAVVLAITAALGPAVMITGKMISSVGSIISLSGKMISGITGLLVKVGLKTAATTADTVASTANATAQGANAAATAAAGTAATGASIGFGALNMSMIAIVAAIAAVIVIVVLLVKNWDKIKEKAKEISTAVSEWFEKMKAAVKEKIDAIKNGVTEKFNSIKNTMSNTMQNAKNLVQSKLNNIKNAYNSNGGGIKGIVAATMTGVKEYYKTGFDAVNAITGGKLGDMLNTVKNKMSNVKSTIQNTLKSVVNSALTWGKDLIDNFVGGITNGISKVGDAVKKIADKVKSLIGFSEPEDGPLSKFHTFAPDMIDLFTKGIKENMPQLDKAMNIMSSSVQTALVNGINPNVNITAPIEKTSTAAGKGDIIVNQTNNYSRAHSQRELWKSKQDLKRTISQQLEGAY